MKQNAKNVAADTQAIAERIWELSAQGHYAVEITNQHCQKLAELVALLCKWNQALNLTAIRDPMEMVVLHIMDSMSVEPYIHGKNIADVGTGPGFPGLVLAILHPEIKFTLIDSVAKKLSFVRTACASLNITNVVTINKRCEDIVADGGFDCIVSRAFASLHNIVSWCRHLVSAQGILVAMKANLTDDELAELPADAHVDAVEKLEVPALDAVRHAVILSLSGKQN